MPELNVVFVLLPTEKNLTVINDRREIDEPTFEVFNLNFALVKFQKNGFYFRQSPDPRIDDRTAGIFTCGA